MPNAPSPSRGPRLLDGADPGDIVEAGRLLRAGQVVVIPTDTGYGIAAAVFRPESVDRVFEIKHRDASLRVPVFLPTAADLPLVARDVPAVAWKLIAAYWPGPLSLVLPSTGSVPRAITGGRGTVAVRVPAGRTCLQLLEFLGEPVTGTSANISGQPGALTADDVVSQLGSTVDAVLVDDSAIVRPKASTVVELRDGTFTVHREGAIGSDALRAAASGRTGAAGPLFEPRNRR